MSGVIQTIVTIAVSCALAIGIGAACAGQPPTAVKAPEAVGLVRLYTWPIENNTGYRVSVYDMPDGTRCYASQGMGLGCVPAGTSAPVRQ